MGKRAGKKAGHQPMTGLHCPRGQIVRPLTRGFFVAAFNYLAIIWHSFCLIDSRGSGRDLPIERPAALCCDICG